MIQVPGDNHSWDAVIECLPTSLKAYEALRRLPEMTIIL